MNHSEVPRLPFLLAFLVTSLAVLSSTYADSLFLSTYPRNWLTYYFIANPVVTIILFFFINPFLSRATPRQSFGMVLVLMAILGTCYALMFTYSYIMPFILCLLLTIFSVLINIMVWSAISSAFDIREYKNQSFKLNICATMSVIITAFLVPLAVHFFNGTGLFYAALIIYILVGYSLLTLKQQPSTPTKKQIQIESNLNKQPFFIAIIGLAILYTLVDVLATFAYKSALLGDYNQNELANFISLFRGSLSVVGLLIQLLLARHLFIWIGLTGILFILPICYLLIGGVIGLWPTFVFFVLFKWFSDVFLINFSNPCRQMLFNPYPSALRRKVKGYALGYAVAVGSLLGALSIVIISHDENKHSLGVLVVMLSLGLLYMTREANKGYQNLLHVALQENRYDPDLLNLNPESVSFMHQDILSAIQSDDGHAIRAGLSFLNQEAVIQHMDATGLPEAIEKILANPNADIRYKAATALKRFNATDATQVLLTQFKQEHDPTVGWAILDCLWTFGYRPHLLEAMEALKSPEPFIFAYGLITLDHQQKAQQVIDNLLNGSIQERYTLAEAERYLHPSAQQNQRLERLLEDASERVSIKAINGLTSHSSIAFIPKLIQLLKKPRQAWFAERALAHFQDKALPYLLNSDPSKSSVRLLARLSQPSALHALIALSKGPSIGLRHAISKAVFRHASYNLKQTAMRDALTSMVLWIAEEIVRLSRLTRSLNEGTNHEIRLQRHMNRVVFMAWFGAIVGRTRVAAIAHYIENPEQYRHDDVSKAYELLDSLAINASLREAVEKISQTYAQNQPILGSGINPSIIMLEQHAMIYKESYPMNTMDKIALLRRITLFSELPAESLQAIASVVQETDMASGERLFSDQDESDRFYCIASGQVLIKKGEHLLAELHEADYFGELGLLDDMPRAADAIAATNGVLLYIEKNEFMHILEDLPEIMRAVVKQTLVYLRQNLSSSRLSC